MKNFNWLGIPAAVLAASTVLVLLFYTPREKLIADVSYSPSVLHPVIQEVLRYHPSIYTNDQPTEVARDLALRYNPALFGATNDKSLWTITIHNDGDKKCTGVQLVIPADYVSVKRQGSPTTNMPVQGVITLNDVAPQEPIEIMAWTVYADDSSFDKIRLTYDLGVGKINDRVLTGIHWRTFGNTISSNSGILWFGAICVCVFVISAIWKPKAKTPTTKTPPAQKPIPANIRIVSSNCYPLTIARGKALTIEYVIDSAEDIPEGIWLGASMWKNDKMYCNSNEDKPIIVRAGRHTYSRTLSIDRAVILGVHILSASLWYGPVSNTQESKTVFRLKPAGKVTVVEVGS